MRRALANAAAAVAARRTVEQQQRTAATAAAAASSSTPLAAAAAVARVLMRASHAARLTSMIASQYPLLVEASAAGAAAVPAGSSRPFSSSSSSNAPATSRRDHQTSPTSQIGDTYDVRVTLRAYDLRFLEETACAVQDLVLINLAPKPAQSLLGTASDGAARAALRDGHGVAFPCLGAAAPPKQRTLYSLIRSPHKYKTSFEQFERVAHRRVVSASTRDHDEVQWLLACLRFYQFTGVEVEVSVTSAPTYLLPASAEAAARDAPSMASVGGAVVGSSVSGGSAAFAAHRARFAALFDDAAAALAAGSGGAVEGFEGHQALDAEIQREAVATALRGLREALSGGGGGAGDEEAAAAAFSSSSSSAQSPQHPLLAAVDRVLGGLDVDALVREELERRRAAAAGGGGGGGGKKAAAAAAPPSLSADLLSIPPELLEQQKAPAEGEGEQASSSPSDNETTTAADWLYAAMEKQKKQQQQQAPAAAAAAAAAAAVDERAALAAAREQYARFAAALQVALLRGWAARVEGSA